MIFLSFAAVKAGNLEDAKTQIKQEITRLYWENRNLMKEDIFGEDERELYYRTTVKMDDVTAQDSLRNLSVWMERYYGKKVIILLTNMIRRCRRRMFRDTGMNLRLL